MVYEFSTNWSLFSDFAGGVTGPLLAYEVLTAFVLEAGFLGVMLFGWQRVGPGLHFTSTVMVALGASPLCVEARMNAALVQIQALSTVLAPIVRIRKEALA